MTLTLAGENLLGYADKILTLMDEAVKNNTIFGPSCRASSDRVH